MSWKSSLTGALLVIVAGLAVGFAIGGKTTQTTVTVTHQQTVSKTLTLTTTVPGKATTLTLTTTVPGKATTVTDTTTTPVTSTPVSTSTTGNASQQYYANYLNTQNTGNNSDQASLDDNPSTQEVNGNTYANAVAFDLVPGDGDPTDTYQLPIPGFATFTAPLAGLVTSNSASASYKLTIYKNNDNPGATVLYSNTFTGPSGVHPVSFATQGATDLLLVWTNTSYDINTEGNDTFVFADPVVTTGK